MRIVTALLFGLLPLLMQAQTKLDTLVVSDDVFLVKVTDNVYVHVSHGTFAGYGRVASNGVVYTDGCEAFLFDTPVNDTLTRQLVEFLANRMQLKVVGFVPNHWHSDCMGGLGYLQSQNIVSYANQATIEICQNQSLPQPTHGFTDSLELHFGQGAVKCYYLGAAHSMDNIVVWLPNEKVLFAGCMVKSIYSQNLGNTANGNLATYPKTIGKLASKFKDAKIVVPGHGPFGGTELIQHTLGLATK